MACSLTTDATMLIFNSVVAIMLEICTLRLNVLHYCSLRGEPTGGFTSQRASNMMTSSNGNIFRVTGHLCGEFTSPR